MTPFSVPVPKRMQSLPVDKRGYPVPFFIDWVDENGFPGPHGQGRPDFRAMRVEALLACSRGRVCWICGQEMGSFKAFVIGPMCMVNRTISEPPSHLECATFAAMACPFLANPEAHRAKRPNDAIDAPGAPICRNPGVAVVWVTKTFKTFSARSGHMGGVDFNRGLLFALGEPTRVECFREGRRATRAEVMASIKSGLPELERIAEAERALPLLQLSLVRATKLVEKWT